MEQNGTAEKGMSLSQWCKGRGVPKSTAYNFLKGNGVKTANGLTPQAIALLEQKFPLIEECEVEVINPLNFEPGTHSSSSIVPLSAQPTGFEVALAHNTSVQALNGYNRHLADTVAQLQANAVQQGRQIGAYLGQQQVNAMMEEMIKTTSTLGKGMGLVEECGD